jgi:hypothetical protein
MKTSNKLLLGFIFAIFLLTGWFLVTAKKYTFDNAEHALSENIISINNNLESFQILNVSGNFEVQLIQGDEEKIEISGDERVLENVTTELNDGVLSLNNNTKQYSLSPVNVILHFKQINEMNFLEGVAFFSHDTIHGNNLSLKNSAGSSGFLTLKVQNLNIHSNLGSSLQIQGNVYFLEIDGSSGAEIDASKLISQNCNVTNTSESIVNVNVTQTLEADVSSGAMLKYSGAPNITKFTTSTEGNIIEN